MSETVDRTKAAAECLRSATRSLRNHSSSLEQLWRGVGVTVRSSWSSLLSDDKRGKTVREHGEMWQKADR